MHLYVRLKARFAVEIVPGVTGMSGCWTAAGMPMTWGDDVLTVLPGTLPPRPCVERLQRCDAAVIMKLGRNLAKVRAALADAGLLDARSTSSAARWRASVVTAARATRRRRGALFLAGARARPGAAAVTRRARVVGLGPGPGATG